MAMKRGGAHMDVLIVGGGIGGPAPALALEKAGIPSRVFESSPENKAGGGGINILPPAANELAPPGLAGGLTRAALPPAGGRVLRPCGPLTLPRPAGR